MLLSDHPSCASVGQGHPTTDPYVRPTLPSQHPRVASHKINSPTIQFFHLQCILTLFVSVYIYITSIWICCFLYDFDRYYSVKCWGTPRSYAYGTLVSSPDPTYEREVSPRGWGLGTRLMVHVSLQHHFFGAVCILPANPSVILLLVSCLVHFPAVVVSFIPSHCVYIAVLSILSSID